MERDDIAPAWRLADPLTVQQAAALIAGHDPNHVCYEDDRPAYFKTPDGYTSTDGLEEMQAAFAAITNAIIDGKLKAIIRHEAWARGWGEDVEDGEIFSERVTLHPADWGRDVDSLGIERAGFIYRVAPDWSRTTVTVNDLNAWLRSRDHPPLFSGEIGSLGPWPWGSYTTRRLELVAEVVRQFWSTYDPDQPTTAPTNEAVEAWLVEEKRISKREAKAIAMICRADDAPTGKRCSG